MDMFVKFVVLFLLLILSSSIKANTICFVSDSSSSFEFSDEYVSALTPNDTDNFILYAVLDLNPSAESVSFFNGLRLRKILDSSNTAIKSIIKQLSIMDTSFVANKCKFLYSNNFSSSMMTCNSYILALKRIQI